MVSMLALEVFLEPCELAFVSFNLLLSASLDPLDVKLSTHLDCFLRYLPHSHALSNIDPELLFKLLDLAGSHIHLEAGYLILLTVDLVLQILYLSTQVNDH